MKLTILSCLISILPCLVVSNPQITQSCSGSHCDQNNAGNPAGPVAQNCQDSLCEQNNAVGRRKREIVAEILAEAVDAIGREERSIAGHGPGGDHHAIPPVNAANCLTPYACIQNNAAFTGRSKRDIVAEILAEAVDAVGREERSAPVGHGHGHGGDHHHIPPVNVPHINIPPVNVPDVHIPDVHIPDVHIPDVHIPDVHVPHVQVSYVPPPHHQPHHGQPPQHHESPQHHKRSADPQQISQSCSGSQCNQNNVLGTSTGFFASIAQNCANGACNQNNVLNGRRKREVIAQLIEEARKIAEEEVEAEEALSRKKRQISQNILNGIGNQNNVASGGHGAGVQFSGPAFQFPSISQNCAHGACNQNNVLGRRKREIIAAILLDESI